MSEPHHPSAEPATSALPEPVASRMDPDAVRDIITHGQLEPEGRLVEASNTTLRCWVSLAGARLRCVYKPVSGERPLWDFPDGTLAGRELATYLISSFLGDLDPAWDLVPLTVFRDGPLGTGIAQVWIEDTGEPLVGFVPEDSLPSGWHPIAAAQDDDGSPYLLAHADDPRLARLAILDAVVNNADRKGGHVLLDSAGHLYGVDHGLCLHAEPKLRTVLWGWAGRPLPVEADPVLRTLGKALDGDLGQTLADHLTGAELAAVRSRLEAMRDTSRFAMPTPHWPSVPWPPI